MRKFSCIGHRGAKGYEPENTLRSIRRALGMGVDGVEIDVYFVDGELVVIHDETLERTTNGRGRVEEQTFDDLRSLDAGKGEKIPTLREVFDAVDRKAFINVELKGLGTAKPVAALIREYMESSGWSREDFLVSSFDIAELQKFVGSGLRLAPLFSKLPADYLAIAKSLDAWSIHTGSRAATLEFVAETHSAGMKAFVYTINEADEIRRMREMGMDGIFSDFPDRVIAVVK